MTCQISPSPLVLKVSRRLRPNAFPSILWWGTFFAMIWLPFINNHAEIAKPLYPLLSRDCDDRYTTKDDLANKRARVFLHLLPQSTARMPKYKIFKSRPLLSALIMRLDINLMWLLLLWAHQRWRGLLPSGDSHRLFSPCPPHPLWDIAALTLPTTRIHTCQRKFNRCEKPLKDFWK